MGAWGDEPAARRRRPVREHAHWLEKLPGGDGSAPRTANSISGTERLVETMNGILVKILGFRPALGVAR